MNGMSQLPKWRGENYYGRSQLKPAPFNNWVVGGYVALAGMCGAVATLTGAAELVGLRPASMVRRGRLIPLLAPTLGAGLLVWDLHTPQRFYNMFRVVKGTSPMSVGTWILSGFSLSSIASAGLQLMADRQPRRTWQDGLALVASLPAAGLGLGLGTYTAALMAATSTPLWAAAPRALGVRFGSASMASGAAALSIRQEDGPTKRVLDGVCAAALVVELVTDAVQAVEYRKTGVADAMKGGWGLTEKIGATGLGAAVPLALLGLSALRGGGGNLPRVASGLVLAGSLLLRVSMLGAGAKSAEDPAISLRFAQPDNLPTPKRPRRTRSVSSERVGRLVRAGRTGRSPPHSG